MNQRYEVLSDGEEFSGNYCNVHISNGPCDGNTMLPSPYAKVNDGLLDVIFATSGKRSDVFKTLTDYFNGQFEKYDMYSRKLCKKIVFSSKHPIRVQMDGEAFFSKEVEVEIQPESIRFFVPEGVDFVDYSHKAFRK